MINAFFSGMTAAARYQDGLDVIANNMANSSTTGYKAMEASFTDLKYAGLPATDDSAQTGSGVRMSGTMPVLIQGAMDETDCTLDVAIQGDGYFCVKSGDETYYTRAGNFAISCEGSKYCLVTSDGDYVLDKSMKQVTFDELPSDLVLTGPSQETAQEGDPVQLAVVTFPNPYALQNVGGGLFQAGDLTGKSEINYESTVQQGCLERSSVDIIYEMTKMMEAQKGFQFSSKVIQAADELENLSNSLRG